MKKLYTLLVIALIGFIGNAQIVTIPDANFKARLLAATTNNQIAYNSSNNPMKIDANNNGEIELSEALLVYQLNLNSHYYATTSHISNTTGLSAFQNLRKLICFENNLTQIDLLSLTFLEEFNGNLNSLSTLDISNVVHLKVLLLYGNQITSITQNNNIALEQIYLDNNLLTSYDISVFPAIKYVSIQNNNLSSLILTGATNLLQLDVTGNQLTNLDFSTSNLINYLHIASNQLSSISISNLTLLYDFNISSNPLTSLNVNGLNALHTVAISNTHFPFFDGSHCGVAQIFCTNNSFITQINVRNNVIYNYDPDLLDFAFRIYNNPNLMSICVDDNEQNGLAYYNYNTNGNVVVYNGPNCNIPVSVNMGLNDFAFGTYFSVYPIPAKGILNLENKGGITIKTINIYDILGQIVLAIPNAASVSTIDVSNLRTGTYFIKVETDKGSVNTKFLKE